MFSVADLSDSHVLEQLIQIRIDPVIFFSRCEDISWGNFFFIVLFVRSRYAAIF